MNVDLNKGKLLSLTVSVTDDVMSEFPASSQERSGAPLPPHSSVERDSGTAQLHSSVLRGVTSVRKCPVLHVLAAVPVPPRSSLSRSAHSSRDRGIHRVSPPTWSPQLTASAQQFSVFSGTSCTVSHSNSQHLHEFGRTSAKIASSHLIDERS